MARGQLKAYLKYPYVVESYEDGGLAHLRRTTSEYTLCRRRVLMDSSRVYRKQHFPTCFLCIAAEKP